MDFSPTNRPPNDRTPKNRSRSFEPSPSWTQRRRRDETLRSPGCAGSFHPEAVGDGGWLLTAKPAGPSLGSGAGRLCTPRRADLALTQSHLLMAARSARVRRSNRRSSRGRRVAWIRAFLANAVELPLAGVEQRLAVGRPGWLGFFACGGDECVGVAAVGVHQPDVSMTFVARSKAIQRPSGE